MLLNAVGGRTTPQAVLLNLRHGKGLVCFLFTILAACSAKPRVEMVKIYELQSVSASSQHPSFPPQLILDGGPAAENAWHSVTRPLLPQWIQIQYAEPVRLRRFAVQAQYNAPGTSTDNWRRAPRRIEVWGASEPNFKTHSSLGSFPCVCQTPGAWATIEIADRGRPYSYFRFVITENNGDPDFVTIQEMKFFSEE